MLHNLRGISLGDCRGSTGAPLLVVHKMMCEPAHQYAKTNIKNGIAYYYYYYE